MYSIGGCYTLDPGGPLYLYPGASLAARLAAFLPHMPLHWDPLNLNSQALCP